MESENSSVKQANETSENSQPVWTELKQLQSIVIQSRLVQTILRLLDNFLWTVEKCMEWSLPSEEICREEKIVEKPEFVRPLPWILFLPSLIILRMIRMSLNIIILFLGFPQITSNDMMRFVQKIRSYLNTLKSSETKKKHQNKEATSEEKSATESMDSVKRKYSTNSSESEQDEEKEKTLQEQLDQVTSSDNDSEYICSSADRENSSINPDIEDSDPDTSISSTELKDILQDARKWHAELQQREKQIQQLVADAEKTAASAEQATPEQNQPPETA